MDIYKSLAALIESCTDSSANQVDEKLFSNVADMIRARADMYLLPHPQATAPIASQQPRTAAT